MARCDEGNRMHRSSTDCAPGRGSEFVGRGEREMDLTTERRLPDFLVVGAVKAGTTWLWNVLLNHPGLYFPSQRKELRFFNEHWERGVAWYASWFTTAGERSAGEVSPEYLHFEPAAERIYSIIPDVKLIVVLRDPVERAYSHVRMHCKRGTVSPSAIDEAVLQPFFVEPGRYGKHLTRYLDFFRRDQLLVVRFEDLVHNAHRTTIEILESLDVDTGIKLPIDMPPANRGRHAPLSRSLGDVLSALDRVLRNVPAGPRIRDRLGRWGLAAAMQRLNRGEKFPLLSPVVRRRLREQYEEDVRRLSTVVGEDFTPWLNDDSV